MDGFCRRWVDVTWTAVPALRKLETDKVKYVYFVTLMMLAALGLIIIWLTEKPGFVFKLATTGYNFALAFSAWHTLVVNSVLIAQRIASRLVAAHRPSSRRLLLHLPRHHVRSQARRAWYDGHLEPREG